MRERGVEPRERLLRPVQRLRHVVAVLAADRHDHGRARGLVRLRDLADVVLVEVAVVDHGWS